MLSAHQAAVVPGAAPAASGAAHQHVPGVARPAAASAQPRAVLQSAPGLSTCCMLRGDNVLVQDFSQHEVCPPVACSVGDNVLV